ncbi:MAG: DUF4062 domain-containing protein [Oscillospiraceae bacterium]|nr:DUF4062 domain-containing protein [Oscillospiraceae bacterium]
MEFYMEKRYQVFVSSTYEDLQEERREVMQALLELDCIPAGMELFPASSEDQWSLIKRVIDDCDYYLLIIAGRYGSTNDKGISYTQMEFEYALSTGKPIIAFLHKNPDKIESGKTEKTARGKKLLEEFRAKAKRNLVRFWETPVELGAIVSRSMVSLIKNFPAEGWIKAGSIVDEKSIKEISRLQNENKSLRDTVLFENRAVVEKRLPVLQRFDKNPKQIDICCIAGIGLFSHPGIKARFEDLIQHGCKVRFIINTPDSRAAFEAAKLMIVGGPFEQRNMIISNTLNELLLWKKQYGKLFSVRTTDLSLPCSIPVRVTIIIFVKPHCKAV